MSYTTESVLDKADNLCILVSYKPSTTKDSTFFRFHGKSGKIVEVEGSDNAMAFLSGVEFAHGFKHVPKEFKAMNKTVAFRRDIKPVAFITVNRQAKKDDGAW